MLSFYKILKMDTITARMTVSNVSTSYCVPDYTFLPEEYLLEISSDSVTLSLCVCTSVWVWERQVYTWDDYNTPEGWRNIMGVFTPQVLYGSKSIWHQTSVILIDVNVDFWTLVCTKELFTECAWKWICGVRFVYFVYFNRYYVVFETPNNQGGTLNLNQLHLHYKIMYLLDALSKAT